MKTINNLRMIIYHLEHKNIFIQTTYNTLLVREIIKIKIKTIISTCTDDCY